MILVTTLGKVGREAARLLAEVAHVIKITSSASPDSPIARRRDQSVIEAALIASGLDHTLTPPFDLADRRLHAGVVGEVAGDDLDAEVGEVGSPPRSPRQASSHPLRARDASDSSTPETPPPSQRTSPPRPNPTPGANTG